MSVSNFPSFETGDYFEWMIKQSLLNSAFALSEELWRSWSVLYMYAKNKKKTKASVYILKPSVSVTLLDLHNSSDDTQTLNIYHRHTHLHLLPIIVWSVQVIYINLSVEGSGHYRQQTLIVIVKLTVEYM